MEKGGGVTGSLVTAWHALELGRWERARRDFESALAVAETAEALEGLGAAAWWLEDVPLVLASRERAYRLFRARDDRLGAGRMATELGFDYAVFKLEMAVSSGWFQRAHQLLDDRDGVAERVWLALREAELAYHTAGDMDQTRLLAMRAKELAVGIGLNDLEMMSLALEGLALVGLGQMPDGMLLLDAATAAAVSGDMGDLKAVAATCCFMVFACERVRDVDRASQWCDQLMAFCRRNEMRAYLAFCRAHQASVLVERGRWAEADEQLASCREALRAHVAWSLTVFERLGELRRRQGRLAEAREEFVRAFPHPGGVLGAARVAIDEGGFDVALDQAEGLLRRMPARDRVERVAALEVLVRARCAAGQVGAAEGSASELASIAGMVGTTCLLASASHCRGMVALASGDAATANDHLRDALDRYERAGLPYEASVVAMDRAAALRAVGRTEAALTEARRALGVLRDLGAVRQAERAETMVHELAGAPEDGSTAGVLSPRETQVLGLLAHGLSNQQIADELTLSRHTVRRHVSNVLTKLGVGSRTAAAAHAFEHRLV
jgi:LuxR family maltose regulon positive regulatory protein